MTSARVVSSPSFPRAATLAQAGQEGGPARDWSRNEFEQAVTPLVPRRLCLVLSDDTAQAEDLLQASLIRAYRHRAGFLGTGTLLGWPCRIARNEHIEHRRKEVRRKTLFEAAKECAELAVQAVSRRTIDPEAWICSSDAAAYLVECLREVSETTGRCSFIDDTPIPGRWRNTSPQPRLLGERSSSHQQAAHQPEYIRLKPGVEQSQGIVVRGTVQRPAQCVR